MQNSAEAITPQQLETEAKTAYANGDYSLAAKSFSAAQQGYKSIGDEVLAAEMANNCCVALLQEDAPAAAQEAYEVVEGTISVFKEAGDLRRQAMALGNRASAMEALGNLNEAIEDYEDSSRILKEIGANDLRMDVMKSLSALQLKTGRSLEALATMQAEVDGVEKPNLKQRLLKRLLSLPRRFLGR
ncbi:MAG: hypothetical protein H8D34_17840 [Chloroflexi bacterium]|nr:hypothetical protein [Chloroflexota bacterium]